MARRWMVTAAAALMLVGLYAPNARANEPAPPSTPPAAVTQPVANDGPWVDMGRDHWAYSAAVKLKEAGVIALDPSGNFRPNDPVTRAELFKMILTARRIDAGGACSGLFEDVPCTAWFAPTAETAYRMAIAEGRGVGQFDPQGHVTRQELFVALVRGLGRRWDASKLGWAEINRRLDTLGDGNAVASWAQPAVAWALGEKLAVPAGGLFRPTAVTTRAEAAVAISRILLPADQATLAEVDGRKVFFAAAHPDMVASMYAQGEPGVGTQTYTGVTVRVGSIAVDPNVIPLGRLLFVEGYGYGVAADIGGAIKGNRIDMYTTDLHEAALKFGLQPRRVWVLP